MEDKEDILKKSHQEYVDWWLPIDVKNGSIMGGMSYNRFLEALLTFTHEDFFMRWIGDKIPSDKIIPFKVYILRVVINNYIEFSKQK